MRSPTADVEPLPVDAVRLTGGASHHERPAPAIQQLQTLDPGQLIFPIGTGHTEGERMILRCAKIVLLAIMALITAACPKYATLQNNDVRMSPPDAHSGSDNGSG